MQVQCQKYYHILRKPFLFNGKKRFTSFMHAVSQLCSLLFFPQEIVLSPEIKLISQICLGKLRVWPKSIPFLFVETWLQFSFVIFFMDRSSLLIYAMISCIKLYPPPPTKKTPECTSYVPMTDKLFNRWQYYRTSIQN
jgi:hypothetical protein